MKQSVGCGVKRLVLVNPGTLVSGLIDLSDITSIHVENNIDLRIKFPFKKNGLPYCEARL